MADNTEMNPGTGGDLIASDELSTINGGAAAGGLKVQRVKIGQGVDGSFTDVSTSNPLPVIDENLASKFPDLYTTIPDNLAPAHPVRMVGQDIFCTGFSDVGSGLQDPNFTALKTGTGFTISQAAGGLVIATGTTTNSEFLARTTFTRRGSFRVRFSTVLTQRIANNNFVVLIADNVGEALTYNIVSATVVDVTLTGHGFTTKNVGQFMYIGGITGAAGIPGRYAIGSIIDVNTIRFTVSAWPASGTGTLCLFGRTFLRSAFSGTTATNVGFDSQRNGWNTGDTTATINTTASPGTIIQMETNGREVFLADALRASSTTPNFTARASRIENIPDDNQDLYMYIWAYNGSTAPASTTTWTISYVSWEKFANIPVYVQGFRANGAVNNPTVNINGTVTTTVSSITAGTNAIGDTGTQYRASATGAAGIVSVLSPATPAASIASIDRKSVV